MWSLQYLKETGFHLPGFFNGWGKLFAIPGKEKRTPIVKKTYQYLKQVNARLWY